MRGHEDISTPWFYTWHQSLPDDDEFHQEFLSLPTEAHVQKNPILFRQILQNKQC